ncbi:diguanylate cyclase [Psychromonas aquatilis]|uniref:diguanylate cyclase n=1 Tax=Psychromonas aquatilis TaxID=2005072 RepID=A0ABU9GTK0_9GAMM
MKRHSLIDRLYRDGHYQLRGFKNYQPYLISINTIIIFLSVAMFKVQAETVSDLRHEILPPKILKEESFSIEMLASINEQPQKTAPVKKDLSPDSVINKKPEGRAHQISSMFNRIELMINKRRLLEASEELDQLLLIVKEYGQPYLIAKSLIIKGDLYYQRKLYTKAVEQYAIATQYLSNKELATQKELGDTYTKLAESYKRLKNRKLTAASYHKALVIYTDLQNKKLIARTSNTLAEAERYLGHYTAALDYSLNSIEIHNTIDDPIGRAKAYNGAGIIYRHIGLYEKSLEYVYEAYQFYKKEGDSNGIAKTSNQMGLIYTRLKQFEQARFFYQITIDLPSSDLEPKVLASALRELAVIELKEQDYGKARALIERAHKIYQQEYNKESESLSARIIGNIYREEGDIQHAIVFYRRSLMLAKKVGSVIYQVKAQTSLASVLIEKDSKQAIKILTSSLTLAKQIGDMNQQLYAYRGLRKAEKLLTNYEQSLYYAEKEIALSRLIEKQKEEREFVTVKAKFYSHQKEMELKLLKKQARITEFELAQKTNEVKLSKQENKIAELELTKNRYTNGMLIILLIVSIVMVIFIYRRFKQSNRLNKKLDTLAATDPLTGCYNRRFLFSAMSEDFKNIQAFEEYSLILLDIDYFKDINDTYGHSKGDQVLVTLVCILQDSIRKSDTLVRYGGEEFCIVLPGTTLLQAKNIAELLRDKIANANFNNINLTCSFGVSSIQFNANNPEALIEQADLALYQSKENGRNRVTLWDPAFKVKQPTK